jgi:hypothetical protein
MHGAQFAPHRDGMLVCRMLVSSRTTSALGEHVRQRVHTCAVRLWHMIARLRPQVSCSCKWTVQRSICAMFTRMVVQLMALVHWLQRAIR